MVFKKKIIQKPPLEMFIKIKFAIFPTRINENEILWLEKYYIYFDSFSKSGTANPIKGRIKNYKNKEDFFEKEILTKI